ncbi:hypothetical protein EMPS_00496 [Entomortierella parvispora]|uniref:PhoD-like phosphatase domain-containing protein n=1 Tax=Entomortierella parvispora TaxID=205924 RepID=A0A9P3H178_9FUNG|nr:hypothetical protein EMPS_00496 [Entomortierella parvispora]
MDFLGDIAHTVSDRISHIIHGDEHHENEDQVKNLSVQDPNNAIADRNPLLDDDEEVEDAAIEAARQEYESIKPSPQFKCGPVLRYQDTLVDQRRWVGSVLVVTDRQDPPRLVIQDPTKSQVGYASPRRLETWEGNHFYRYEIQLSLLKKREKNIKYWFETENGRRVQTPQTWNFFVPALENAFNWAFYSCNGFTSDVEDPETNFHGANPLWDDLLAAHDGKPFHAMVGGGDQIYNDDVLATPEMVEWLALDEEARVATEFTNDKKYAVEKFYFDHYTSHFTSGTYSKALSLIPMVNCWDDHDIIDGYGSYPAKYQLCAVMQGIGAAAAKFYLLFQQHASGNTTEKAGLITASSGKGWSCITHFGKRTLMVLPDTRSERSKETILSDSTYELLQQQINAQLLPSTRHLVIVLGTPLVYPALTLFEDALETMGETLSRGGIIGKVFGKCKAFENVLGQFGPELLDDLVDSWACNIHTAEKKKLVELLQTIAVQRGVRVTFVGGDVHVGGAGRLFGTTSTSPLRDPYHMTQIVSSAIVNGPPPGAVISALHRSSKTYPLNDFTSEEMTEIFNQDVTGEDLEQKKLLNRRNWCEVRELSGFELEFTIRIENEDHVGTKKYPILVDRLEIAEREQ